MISNRSIAICLLEILKEYSDEQHILSMSELISKFTAYDMKPDRRTVYSAIEVLAQLGYDISTYEENGKGYYLREREFETSEVMLLTDAVYSFPFLPAKQSEQLIQKLQKQLSVHQRKAYKHLTVARSDRKTDNRQVFWNISTLDDAIASGKQVSFAYMQYDMDKQLHPRREKPYIVNPYGMVYMNEHYYLICNLDGYPNTSLYRIDRIRDIEVLNKPLNKMPYNSDEVQDAVYAFSGSPERIVMHCNKLILGDVIDRFGTAIQITEKDDDYFTARFTAPARGIKFWALQYLPYVEVTEPEWLREEIISSVKQNMYGVE